VCFDPYQMQAVAQRLTRAGVRMVEFSQSVASLTESSTEMQAWLLMLLDSPLVA
jgi:hypothetical protein